MTSLGAPASFPAAAPDGRWIYFTSYAKDGMALFRVVPDDSGVQQLTTDGDAREAVVSRDGKTLYYTAMNHPTARSSPGSQRANSRRTCRRATAP
jgi:Tol biopolymer transport system component